MGVLRITLTCKKEDKWRELDRKTSLECRGRADYSIPRLLTFTSYDGMSVTKAGSCSGRGTRGGLVHDGRPHTHLPKISLSNLGVVLLSGEIRPRSTRSMTRCRRPQRSSPSISWLLEVLLARHHCRVLASRYDTGSSEYLGCRGVEALRVRGLEGLRGRN